jgi:hypothetical protein
VFQTERLCYFESTEIGDLIRFECGDDIKSLAWVILLELEEG